MSKQQSQRDVVLAYLKKHKGITSLEAFEKWHITRLSAVIFDLRKMGHDIVTVDIDCDTKFGHCTYAQYRLVK